MMRLTFITGDQGSGKSSIALGLKLLNENVGGWEHIIIDDKKLVTGQWATGPDISPSSLLVSLRGRMGNDHKTHVILVGDACKPHLDAILASYPKQEYTIVGTARVSS